MFSFIIIICSMLFIFFDPIDSFAHFPVAFSLFAFFNINSFSMLFSVFPFTYIVSAIRPFKSTLTVFLIVFIFSDVLSAIRPGESTISFHLIIEPLSIVDSAIGPPVFSSTFDIIFVEVTFESALIRPLELSFTVFHSFFVVSFILRAIWPLLFSIALLLIKDPITREFRTVVMGIDSITMSFILNPISLIHIAFCMD